MASANVYAALAEFKDRLGIDTGDHSRDYALDHVLQASSRWIDGVLGRRFYASASPEVRYFTVCNYYGSLEIDDVLSVTELATDANGDGTYETVWTEGTDFYLGERNAPQYGQPYTCVYKKWWTGRYSFPAYPDAIRITGTWGYCTLANVPPGIRELCMMVAETDAGPVNDLVIPGVATYKLGNELTVTAGGKNLTSRAAAILDQYRNTRQGAFVT